MTAVKVLPPYGPLNLAFLRFHAAADFPELGRLESRDGCLVSMQEMMLDGAARPAR